MWKSVILTNFILNNSNEFDKINIYSPSLHEDLYRKLFKCFSNYIPNNIFPNILDEEDIDIVIDEIVHIIDFEKTDTEIKTYEKCTKIEISSKI